MSDTNPSTDQLEQENTVSNEDQTPEHIADTSEPVPEQDVPAPEGSNPEREAYLRLKADYDNLVKRHEREKDEMKKFFTTHIVKKLLPAYDTLSRISDHSTSDTSSEVLLTGVQSAKDIFEKSLSSLGVVKFESV